MPGNQNFHHVGVDGVLHISKRPDLQPQGWVWPPTAEPSSAGLCSVTAKIYLRLIFGFLWLKKPCLLDVRLKLTQIAVMQTGNSWYVFLRYYFKKNPLNNQKQPPRN